LRRSNGQNHRSRRSRIPRPLTWSRAVAVLSSLAADDRRGLVMAADFLGCYDPHKLLRARIKCESEAGNTMRWFCFLRVIKLAVCLYRRAQDCSTRRKETCACDSDSVDGLTFSGTTLAHADCGSPGSKRGREICSSAFVSLEICFGIDQTNPCWFSFVVGKLEEKEGGRPLIG
jgi:hypothetical protein